jgi:hypothetical protein
LQGRHQGHVQVGCSKPIEGLEFGRKKWLSSEFFKNKVFDPVHLQVDLNAMLMLGDLINQLCILGQADPIGVDHHVMDRLGKGILKDLLELRMKRRLTPRELKHIGLALGCHQRIDRAFDLVERLVLEPRSAIGIAHATGKVAVVGDLQYRHARVLLVV